MTEQDRIQSLPLLPLKNAVLFPHLLMPLTVGRPVSMAAVEAALSTEEKELVLVAQKDAAKEVVTFGDLYGVGTKAVVKKVSRQSGVQKIIVLGTERVSLLRLEQTEPHMVVRCVGNPLVVERTTEAEALQRAVQDLAQKAISLSESQVTAEMSELIQQAEDPVRFVYLLASLMSLDLAKEQALLEAGTHLDALRIMLGYLAHEVQVLELRSKINSQAQTEMTKAQREYFLRQQLRAIQQELGEGDPQRAEAEQLRERLAKADLPDDVRKEAERELSRFERLPSGSPEHQVLRTYLDYVLELPWRVAAEDALDIARARAVLDEDHFGLKDVKERILEHLGVLKMNPGAKAPILCLFGPPGVGKTSLGQSIARTLGRKFERMSLGGMHDEAELRGHRRTYIGALPGRIVQAIRRAGQNNPVLMLDEIDKLGRDFRGDPAAALLEILDPEQNKEFRDNYLDLPFDLSKVFFITTANTLDTIPRPLLDRMEVLRLQGYCLEEKIAIAHRYLIPRQLTQVGLTAEQFAIEDVALNAVIARYTREAGLRQLERAIGRLARKAALRFAEGTVQDGTVTVRAEDLLDLLGPAPVHEDDLRKEQVPGVATGLAWTETGGEVLYVEATLLPGGKDLTLTGQLGEVMRESAVAARTYVWSHAQDLGLDPALFKEAGMHVHVPAGAVPKDGPSAGVAMATAMVSAYTGMAQRIDTAMTGEITLTGMVLPIGGVKEKVLAARRARIRRVILPRANEKDLRDVPDSVRADLEFVFVDRIQDVWTAAIPQLADQLAAAHVA